MSCYLDMYLLLHPVIWLSRRRKKSVMYLMQIISGLRYKFFETLNFYAHELLSNFISRNASNTLSLSSTLFLTFSPDGIY